MAVTHWPPAVALVGFMGAGKSAVGRALAEVLRVPFIDTDDLIAAHAGPLDTIFRERGEQGFRALEAEIVKGALAGALERPCVLALGGGAVLRQDVRKALLRLPNVAWLSAPLDVLWSRATAPGQPARPLATDREAFGELLAVREPLYRQVATRVVDVTGKSPEALAADLAAGLRGCADLAAPVEGGTR